MDSFDGGPAWATDEEFPEPGATEYVRPVASVMCADSREELSVCLVQRNDGPAQVSMAGMRMSVEEADLVFRALQSAVALIRQSGVPSTSCVERPDGEIDRLRRERTTACSKDDLFTLEISQLETSSG